MAATPFASRSWKGVRPVGLDPCVRRPPRRASGVLSAHRVVDRGGAVVTLVSGARETRRGRGGGPQGGRSRGAAARGILLSDEWARWGRNPADWAGKSATPGGGA